MRPFSLSSLSLLRLSILALKLSLLSLSLLIQVMRSLLDKEFSTISSMVVELFLALAVVLLAVLPLAASALGAALRLPVYLTT